MKPKAEVESRKTAQMELPGGKPVSGLGAVGCFALGCRQGGSSRATATADNHHEQASKGRGRITEKCTLEGAGDEECSYK
jgi:hypothetical protein